MSFPTFDGHFWIERDDKIVDFHFCEYDFIKMINGCNGEQVYLPAPEITQKVALNIMEKVMKNAFKTDTIDEAVEKYYKLATKIGRQDAHFAECPKNVLVERHLRGGKIVFGSMGWKKKNGDIHFEYGGTELQGYKTWKDFAR